MLLACIQAAALVVLASAVWILGELDFLAPYKHVLLRTYAIPALLFVLLVYLNLVAFLYVGARHVTRSHMGQRLEHVERELRTSDRSVNPGLTRRLHP